MTSTPLTTRDAHGRARPTPPATPPLRSRVPRLIGTALGVYALVALVLSISPALRDALVMPRVVVDALFFPLPDTSLSWALALGLLSLALLARKRLGWAVLLALTVLWAVEGVLIWQATADRLYLAGAVVQVALLALYLWSAPEFYAKARRVAPLKAAAVLLGGLVVATLLGWAMVEAAPGSLAPTDRFWWALNRVAAFGAADDDAFTGRPPVAVSVVLGLLGALVLLSTVYTLFRSRRSQHTMSATDETSVRALVAAYGEEDSLGYFATRRDKSVVFAPSGRAAVTYRVELSVCLASGDPVGDPAHWDEAIAAWLHVCRTFGWGPAVMGASAKGAHAYRAAGLDVIELGDEAILRPETFSLKGPRMKGVRQAATRVRRQGVTVRIRRHRDLTPEEMDAAIAFADSARDTEEERGFSMALGRLGDPADGDCLFVEADRADGAGGRETVGLLSFVPWGRTGVSLDLMRRSREAPNGIVELMVAELCRTGPELGIRQVSLNFAVFRSVFEDGAQLGAGPVVRGARRVLLFFSRWWQIESLYRSNAKYDPEWVPRYLCFEDGRNLAWVGVASGVAEGFVTLPRVGGRAGGDASGDISSPGSAAAAAVAAELAKGEVNPAPMRRPEQVRVRLRKAQALLDAGRTPWPEAVPPSHAARAALDEEDGTTVSVAGRVLALRDLGGVTFALLRDGSGDLQVVLDAERVGRDALDDLGRHLDLGDLVQVEGVVGSSRSGERSVLASTWRLNAKALHPLPDKRCGLTDPEAQVRQRHVDLAVNPQARAQVVRRSAVLHSLREELHGRGYLEVETPILQQVHGGANARPFETHINAYDLDLYLRIAPELYLKRLCVGGVERVFELGRTFRNEGADFSHNPEFTMLEAYQAHGDYHSMMTLCRELIQAAATAANGSPVVPAPDGRLVDISGDWPVVRLYDAVSQALVARGGAPVDASSSAEEMRAAAEHVQVAVRPGWDPGQIALELYEELVEQHTTTPTFYCDFPLSVSPLTRSHRTDPGVVERWDLVAWGVELGTAYSELTDPVEQRRRLTAQSLQAAGGDVEAMELDEDFLEALELGMPPTGGLGIGVDRLVMLVTGASIRQTLPFPMVRPTA